MERDYMWIINRDVIEKNIKDAMKNRKSSESIDQNEHVEANSSIYKEITEDVAQKGNDEFNNIWFI